MTLVNWRIVVFCVGVPRVVGFIVTFIPLDDSLIDDDDLRAVEAVNRFWARANINRSTTIRSALTESARLRLDRARVSAVGLVEE
jgi:hypothetical protein